MAAKEGQEGKIHGLASHERYMVYLIEASRWADSLNDNRVNEPVIQSQDVLRY